MDYVEDKGEDGDEIVLRPIGWKSIPLNKNIEKPFIYWASR